MKTIGYAAQSRRRPPRARSSSSAAHCARTTSRWRSSTAASATPTCTWRATTGAGRVYPLVPGHEIVGRVTAVGAEVDALQGRRRASAVGCMVDSCQQCDQCRDGRGAVLPRGQHPDLQRPGPRSPANHLRRLFEARRGATRTSCCACPTGSTSRAPRRCCAPASPPIRRCAPGMSGPAAASASIGLGGLGHMAVKLANALGADVTVLSRIARQGGRCAGARRRRVRSSRRDAGRDDEAASSFDLIIDTVPRQARPQRRTCRCSTSTARWCIVGAPRRARRAVDACR